MPTSLPFNESENYASSRSRSRSVQMATDSISEETVNITAGGMTMSAFGKVENSSTPSNDVNVAVIVGGILGGVGFIVICITIAFAVANSQKNKYSSVSQSP